MTASDFIAILQGAVVTVTLSLVGILIGLPIGLGLALLRWANVPVLARVVAVYVSMLRATPLVTLLLLLFFALPNIGIEIDPIYVDTAIGMVVMQFADADPNPRPGTGAVTGPQGLRTDLPTGLPRARMVVKCKLDASGNLKNLQVLEPGPATMASKIMAALPGWKFRPATRGAQPIEVNAILGFNIDTNDRY